MDKPGNKSREEIFRDLVTAKTAAGLSRADAEAVANRQIEEDEAAEKASRKAAAPAKKD